MELPDLARVWGRLVATLGLAPWPPGRRPPPGAAMPRMMFAFVWFILGVIQVSIFMGNRSWLVLVLAAAWFVLGALDVVRAWRLIEAERRAVDDDHAGYDDHASYDD